MSSCPKCLCGYICIVKEVKRGPQNLARWFWTCPLSACAYFRWDTPNDQFHKLPTSKIQSVLDPSAPRGTTTPLCHCKIPCRMFTMKKPGKDFGRNYYKCQQMRCGFYQLGETGTNGVPKIGVARSSSMMDPSMPDFSVANTTSGSRINKVPLTTALTSAQRTDASKYRQKRASKRPVVSMVLHSAYDVSIQLSHPEKRGYLHSIVKVIDGVCWREELNHWVFPADQASCDRVSETLSKYQVNFQVEDLPVGIYHMLPPTRLELLKNHAASQREPRADEDLSWLGSRYEQDRIVSSPLWQQLTPVQKFGIYYCTTKLDGRVYLCDELGTGKSLQALGILLTKSLSGRTLIVCNPSMCLSWKRFIEDSLDVESEDIAMIRIKLPKQKLAKVPTTGTQQQSKLLQKRERQQKQQNRKRARPDPSTSHANATLSSRLDRTFTDEDFGSGQVYLAIKVDTKDPFVLDYNRYYGPEVIFDDQEHAIPAAASSSAADEEPLYNVITTLPQLERSQARFFIIDYDRLWRSPALTNKKWFDDYIFDDSNMVARQTMDKTPWRKRIQKTIGRSHCTIMINDDDLYRRPIHSFAALRLLHPDVFINSKFYGERYCMAERSVFGVNYTGANNLNELETFVTKKALGSTSRTYESLYERVKTPKKDRYPVWIDPSCYSMKVLHWNKIDSDEQLPPNVNKRALAVQQYFYDLECKRRRRNIVFITQDLTIKAHVEQFAKEVNMAFISLDTTKDALALQDAVEKYATDDKTRMIVADALVPRGNWNLSKTEILVVDGCFIPSDTLVEWENMIFKNRPAGKSLHVRYLLSATVEDSWKQLLTEMQDLDTLAELEIDDDLDDDLDNLSLDEALLADDLLA